MRPGADILAAFALAASAHLGLAYWIAEPGGTPGTGETRSATAAVTPAAAAALVTGWKTPPATADTMARLQPPHIALSAAPSPARDADPGPATQRPASLARPSDPAALPAVPEPMPAAMVAAGPAPAPRAPAPTPMPGAVERFEDRAPLRQSATAPIEIAMDRHAGAPDPVPPPQALVKRPEEATARPRPRPSPPPAHAQAQAAALPPSPPVEQPVSRAAGGAGVSAPGAAETRKLQAAWAGAIKARIAQAQRHPGPKYGAGRVRLVLVVSRSGKLSDVRIAASSGSPGLDRAALNAVRAAAPFPKAPSALPDDWMRFGQWVEFRAR